MKYMFALVDYWILGEPLRRRAPEVRSRLASGYALHHLRASPLRVLPFGGSAAIPLAKKKDMLKFQHILFIKTIENQRFT
jgi:hypothetical protein